jgi:hypothetical protein
MADTSKLGELAFSKNDFREILAHGQGGTLETNMQVKFYWAQMIADQANRILAEKLAKAKSIQSSDLVYATIGAPQWTARLVCVEKLGKCGCVGCVNGGPCDYAGER